MAKEFKDFDKKYAHLKHTLMQGELLPLTLDYWPFMASLYKADAATIRRCVYFSGEASEHWQQFRVSLKGWSTGEKLWRLNARYVCEDNTPDEIVRIDNYIDSMRRSGLLDSIGVVIK